MKNKRILLMLLLTLSLVLAACGGEEAPVYTDPTEEATEARDQGEAIILFTGNVRNSFEKNETRGQLGYAALAACRDALEEAGHPVILVDGGNAMENAGAGAVKKGRTLAELIGSVGYDVRVVGETELTYGVADLQKLTEKMDDSAYLSCNLVDSAGETVFASWEVLECNGVQIGFVGITTPHAADILNNEAYGFSQGSSRDDFFAAVQDAIDGARDAGADHVIAVGGLGTDPLDSPWTCAEVIANTTGLTAFLDCGGGVLEGATVTDLDNYEIPVCATGGEFSYVGEITLDLNDGAVRVALLTALEDENSRIAQAAGDLAKELE